MGGHAEGRGRKGVLGSQFLTFPRRTDPADPAEPAGRSSDVAPGSPGDKSTVTLAKCADGLGAWKRQWQGPNHSGQGSLP